MELLTILAIGTLNIVCFFVGAKVGQKVVKGEEIKIPAINPMQYYQEYKDKKEAEAEKSKIETILKNIDRYDGTANGQEDVPR